MKLLDDLNYDHSFRKEKFELSDKMIIVGNETIVVAKESNLNPRILSFRTMVVMKTRECVPSQEYNC